MPRLVPLLVALLAIAAGCTGGPIAPGATDAPPTDTATVTSTDAPASTERPVETTASPPTDTPSDDLNGTIAPGVTADGIENVSVLLEAHATELREHGFELVDARRTTRDGESYGYERRVSVTADLARLRSTATSRLPGDRTVQHSWLDESTSQLLVWIDAENESRYRIPSVGPAGSDARASYAGHLVQTHPLAEVLHGGEFEVTAVDGPEEDRRYTLVGATFATDGMYGERDVELTIDGDGVIRELNATGTLSTGEGESFDFEYRVERVGVDIVEQPDWVASAPEPIDTRPTVGFENCSTPYLTLGNEDPDAVPAGSVVTVTLNGSEHEVTLDTPLDTGEQRALYLDASGELHATDSDSVPTDRTAMPNEAQILVVTGEGVLLTNGAMGFGCASESDGASGGGSAGGGSASGGSAGDGSAGE